MEALLPTIILLAAASLATGSLAIGLSINRRVQSGS